jgi:hypothetical protein
MKEAEAQLVALIAEGVDLGLILLDGLREWLLSLAIFELSKVECSVS